MHFVLNILVFVVAFTASNSVVANNCSGWGRAYNASGHRRYPFSRARATNDVFPCDIQPCSAKFANFTCNRLILRRRLCGSQDQESKQQASKTLPIDCCFARRHIGFCRGDVYSLEQDTVPLSSTGAQLAFWQSQAFVVAIGKLILIDV